MVLNCLGDFGIVCRKFISCFAVALPFGQYSVSNTQASQTPYCPTHSQKMAIAIIWLRACTRSKKFNQTCSENSIFGQFRGRAATASTGHIANSAALPRGINICVFLQPLLALIKCWDAATSAICWALGVIWKAQWEKQEEIY
jgi:hypothetical protein